MFAIGKAFRLLVSAGSSLPARLVIFSIVFVVPIGWFSSLQYRAAERSMRATSVEQEGLEFVARADDAVIAVGRLDQEPTEKARAEVEASVVELERYAAGLRDVPEALTSARRIRVQWERSKGASAAEAAATTGDAILTAIGDVADASRLAFESQVDLGDLGDALDNTYPVTFERLSVAYRRAARGQNHGGVSVSDRISMAGDLAGADAVAAPLALDIAGAFGQNPPLRDRLEAQWHAAFDAAHSLQAPLVALTTGGKPGQGGTPLLRSRHGRLVETGSRFIGSLESVVRDLFAARISRLNDSLRMIVSETVFATFIGLGMVILIGQMFARRVRREVLRVQQETRALSAELARERAERALMLTEAQFRAVFERSRLGIALLDRSGRTIESNAALAAMLGEGEGRLVPAGDVEFAELVEGMRPMYQRERRVTRADSSSWIETTISPVEVPQPESVAAIAMVQDITERKAVDERLRHAATHDELTTLPNRAEFIRHLDSTIARSPGAGSYAVLFIDLDDFKLVNDSLGHLAGDRVLAVTARRIRNASPGGMVARFHGDEFVLLLPEISDALSPGAVADRIQSAVRAPISIGGTPVFINSSVGIVLGHPRYVDAEDVLRDADAAMYQAKSLGGSRSVVFDVEIYRKLANRIRIVTELRHGIEHGEFAVVYQPIVDLTNGDIVAVEALLRWEHPQHGSIPPTDFIPIAEESNAISELGAFALREACATVTQLDRDLPEGRQLAVSINLSVAQLTHGAIVEDVRRTLRETGLRGERLQLEITETGLLENAQEVALVLAQLKELGVRLCIDDFGTGYSSLRYLHQLPIDILKIDRTFVHGADGGLANEPIVVMLLTLAESLKIQVIAEGIETDTQRKKLIAAGCRLGQGFLFSAPVREDELSAWIAAQKKPARHLRIAT